MPETSATATETLADDAEPVDYRWTTIVTDVDGHQRPILHGRGWFDAEDSYTARVHDSHTGIAAAVFAEVCGEMVEYHRDAVLDACIDGQPDPIPPITVTTTVHDAHDTAVAILTGRLLHRPVTEDEVADTAVALGQTAVADARLRIDHLRDPGGASHHDLIPPVLDLDVELRPDIGTRTAGASAVAAVDDDRRQRLRALRAAAADLRAEVYNPEYFRQQLATMEDALAATHTTETSPLTTPPSVEDRAAVAPIDWQARVDRWRRLLEISTEAYLDAARLDTAAEHLRRRRKHHDSVDRRETQGDDADTNTTEVQSRA
ncbi:hypothetical protein OIE68_45475 [Nocardia vinacea]|uniref:hypothetical protein n=1 Tax=Nocardia vinacea TaxID=96468 RepID=UPI002E1470F2|nr:hypothetical protein OIE68_45475 [Nocardia vinacea]